MKKDLLPYLIILSAGIGSFSLSCLISTEVDVRETASLSWSAIFGAASSAIGDEFYHMADRYYHRGVGHARHVHTDDVFLRLSRIVTPEKHAHLEGESEVVEIIPWLRFATRVDPNNIEAYSVAIHWLMRTELIDEAREVLMEALQNNTDDYRVYVEAALFNFRTSNSVRAARYLDRAREIWPRPLASESEEAVQDLAVIYSYRAFVHQLEGELDVAAKMLRREYELFPARARLAATIRRLEQGEVDKEQLERTWRAITRSRLDDECTDHHHHHHH